MWILFSRAIDTAPLLTYPSPQTHTHPTQTLKEKWSKVDLDKDGKVGEMEFLLHRLLEMGKVTAQELHDMRADFDLLDRDNSNFITIGEL